MNIEKQKQDRYEMHKYWGKKPAKRLRDYIEKYSEPNDVLLDPFSGYGVFCAEAYIANRNIIANDLNPIANFINNQLLTNKVDLNTILTQWDVIKKEFEEYNNSWFNFTFYEKNVVLVNILRSSKDDKPIMAKYREKGQRNFQTIYFNNDDCETMIKIEQEREITDWFPDEFLFVNSRISAKNNMKIADLFTKRTLACHARLLHLIKKHSSESELELFMLAFTANLANCSKLIPPIKTRGEMSAGAWMTGFYVGEVYIENNVLHYFENRLKKVIKGKQDYINQIECLENRSNYYEVTSYDAKKLNIKDNSIDYVFTDPPYGDTVPYFEQSIIWNSWLQFVPDYNNEIVVSDSKQRSKNIENYSNEIGQAISEICRVLKSNKFFSITFHSLSGYEWLAITNACLKNNLEMVDYEWLTQKSFTPRQINRLKSIKGDVLITFRKSPHKKINNFFSSKDILEIVLSYLYNRLKNSPMSTNEIFIDIMYLIFSERILVDDFDLLKILNKNFSLSENGFWSIKND